MSISDADPRNEGQIAYWNGARAETWIKQQEAQGNAHMAVITPLIERAAIRAGEHVVDVGCGTGVTTIEIARRVGPSGRVLAIDVSEPMLERARERMERSAPVTFVRADATTCAIPRAAFDLVLSSFGVMFFADPTRSFANLRSALKPDGRLVFACWRQAAENLWVAVPQKAVAALVPPSPPPGPEEPGMFSFGSEARARRILDRAGFRSAAFEPVDFAVEIGRGQGLDAAAAFATEDGPASRLLDGQTQSVRDAATAAVRRALAPYLRNGRVSLAAAVWLVTARA